MPLAGGVQSQSPQGSSEFGSAATLAPIIAVDQLTPATTTLTNATTAGASSLVVGSTTSFILGQQWTIFDGTNNEIFTVATLNSGTSTITAAVPLQYAHAAGVTIALQYSQQVISIGDPANPSRRLTLDVNNGLNLDGTDDATISQANGGSAGGTGSKGRFAGLVYNAQQILSRLVSGIVTMNRKTSALVTNTPLGVSALFTSPGSGAFAGTGWYDSTLDGTNFLSFSILTNIQSTSGGFSVFQSDDPSNATNTVNFTAQTVSANTAFSYYATVTKRYYKFTYQNNTTAQTTFEIIMNTSSNAQVGASNSGALGSPTTIGDGITSSGRFAAVNPAPTSGNGGTNCVQSAAYMQGYNTTTSLYDVLRNIPGARELGVSTGGISSFLLTAAMGTTAQVVKATSGRSARAHPNGTTYTLNVYDTATAGGAVAATLIGQYNIPATGPAVDISYPHATGIVIAATAAVTGQAAFTWS